MSRPGKIVAVGKNYRAHAKEMGGDVPSEPLLFLKATSAIIGDGESIVRPPYERVDYEGELAVFIGRDADGVSQEEASSFIDGFGVANDVTIRDLQRAGGPWSLAKGWNTLCPLSGCLTSTLPRDATLRTMLNGEVVQQAAISEMVFSIAELIAYISCRMTLHAGDVILTGTPQGVGNLQPGDTVSVEVTGVGRIENPVSDGKQ